MNFEDLIHLLETEGFADFTFSSKTVPNGRLETLSLNVSPTKTGVPQFSPKLPANETLVPQGVNLLPPKDSFVYNLRYLLDLAKASKAERSVMERLIKRFEDGRS